MESLDKNILYLICSHMKIFDALKLSQVNTNLYSKLSSKLFWFLRLRNDFNFEILTETPKEFYKNIYLFPKDFFDKNNHMEELREAVKLDSVFLIQFLFNKTPKNSDNPKILDIIIKCFGICLTLSIQYQSLEILFWCIYNCKIEPRLVDLKLAIDSKNFKIFNIIYDQKNWDKEIRGFNRVKNIMGSTNEPDFKLLDYAVENGSLEISDFIQNKRHLMC